MKKYLVVWFFSFALLTLLSAQTDKVNWLSWEEAIELNKVENKKLFVNVYTEWCGWCKRMDALTFDQPHIAEYLNEHFYPVKFNAEYKDEIEFGDKVYKFVNRGPRGYHELAAEMLKGQLSFPSVVFLDENSKVIQPIVGYKSHEVFEIIITYFGTDNYKKVPWVTYEKNYKLNARSR